MAYQGALNTTGHNITNASVEGYSRQRVELDTRAPQFINGAYFGNGVDLETVSRVVDEFVIRQLRTDAWVYNLAETQRFYNEQVDAILADPNIGAAERIESFFNALQSAADDPQWLPNRQVVISEAGTLTDRFNSLYARLADLNSSLNARLDSLAVGITSLARNIADLNAKIEAGFGTSVADLPNDLLDERDRLIQQLSELVDVQTVREGSAVNLFLGKGQALVIGRQSFEVVTTADRFDPTKRQLAVVRSDGPRVVSYEATGGQVGGILQFRDRVLDETLNAIGRIAIAIGSDVNRQNQLGMDLDGDLGGLLFNDVNDPLAAALRGRAASDNDPASTGGVRVFIDDPSRLTTSNYQLDIGSDGSSWQLFRLSDGVLVASGAALNDTLTTVDGFTVDLNLSAVPPGNFFAGDSFILEPTRRGADFFATLMTRAQDLAFALPVRTVTAGGNLGSGAIEVGEVFDVSTAIFSTTARTLSPPLLIRFTSPTSYDVLDASDPENPVALPGLSGLPYNPGLPNTLFSTNPGDPDYFGFQVVLRGDPVAGDAFRVEYNTGGVSDNRNALALAALQTADTLNGGTITYQGAYGELVSFVGTETRQSRIDSESGLSLLNQTQEIRESISGVNLDEEAANLIRFEQAYNASAQVIAVARSIIDALFEAVS